MERIRIDDLENAVQPATRMHQLTGPLGLTDVAINYYELEPGDSFAFAYHDHEIQEEVFVILEGTATFETESGPLEVGPGGAIRFDRGEFQRGWNRGEVAVVALAVGAPLEYGRQVKLRYCEECDAETDNELERPDGEAVVVARCGDCGSETGRWYRGPTSGTVP